MRYATYIGSEAWRRNPARLKALSDADGRCRLCDSNTALEVHHSTYKRMGHEHESDLIALCRDCHVEVTSFLRARRYAVFEPKWSDVLSLRDGRVLPSDPTAEAY
ncbi:HNH endonuclease [Bradyrhizobium genosp. P]|uniref:HNH endonuclease n=1 Tax=Bradyrhizobium genosp. P TaxID=83641 RepID=UPI003CEC4C96